MYSKYDKYILVGTDLFTLLNSVTGTGTSWGKNQRAHSCSSKQFCFFTLVSGADHLIVYCSCSSNLHLHINFCFFFPHSVEFMYMLVHAYVRSLHAWFAFVFFNCLIIYTDKVGHDFFFACSQQWRLAHAYPSVQQATSIILFILAFMKFQRIWMFPLWK